MTTRVDQLQRAMRHQLQIEIGKAETVYGPVRLRKEDTEPDGNENQMGPNHPWFNSQQFAGMHKPESVVTYENSDPAVRAELKQELQQKLANQHGISTAPTATRSG